MKTTDKLWEIYVLPQSAERLTLSCKHTEHQATASSEASDLGNGCGTHLERQVKWQIQVYGDLPLAADAAAQSVHTFSSVIFLLLTVE